MTSTPGVTLGPSVVAQAVPRHAPRSRLFLWATRIVSTVVMLVVIAYTAVAVAVWSPYFDDALVTSGSMKGYANPGDLVLTKRVDTRGLRVGDVVMRENPDPSKYVKFVTHRITKITPTRDGANVITKGDANPTPDIGTAHLGSTAQKPFYVVHKAGKPVWLLLNPLRFYYMGSILLLIIAYLAWPRRDYGALDVHVHVTPPATQPAEPLWDPFADLDRLEAERATKA